MTTPTDLAQAFLPCPFCGCEKVFAAPDEFGSGGQPVPPWTAICEGCAAEMTNEDYDALVSAWNRRARESRAQPASVPEGYALVPERMHLDADTLAAIGFVAGGASDDDARAEEPKAWSEAILWVGNIVGDDGKETYGLNVANAEYSEEGSAQLVEFEQPRPAQPASMADQQFAELVMQYMNRNGVLQLTWGDMAALSQAAPQPPAKENTNA